MSSWDDLVEGTRFTTSTRELHAADHWALVGVGGFNHPLFTDPDHLARTPFDAPPFPGQALLLILGGLVEQTGRVDETAIALVGLSEVDFHYPAVVGDSVAGTVEVLDRTVSSSGRRGTMQMRWDLGRVDGESTTPLVGSIARMLFDLER